MCALLTVWIVRVGEIRETAPVSWPPQPVTPLTVSPDVRGFPLWRLERRCLTGGEAQPWVVDWLRPERSKAGGSVGTKVVWPILCVVAICAIACGDRSSAAKQEQEVAPGATRSPPPSNSQPAVPRSLDEEGPIGVQNSSGRSGAFYVPGGSGINALPLL